MSSFATMNSLQAARTGGLAGTRRAALQPAPQPVQNQQQPLQPGQAPWGQEAGTPVTNGPINRAPSGGGAGMMGTAAQGINGMVAARQGTGVNPGVQQPPLQGPAPIQFDPNDPRNAALAGYMSGG